MEVVQKRRRRRWWCSFSVILAAVTIRFLYWGNLSFWHTWLLAAQYWDHKLCPAGGLWPPQGDECSPVSLDISFILNWFRVLKNSDTLVRWLNESHVIMFHNDSINGDSDVDIWTNYVFEDGKLWLSGLPAICWPHYCLQRRGNRVTKKKCLEHQIKQTYYIQKEYFDVFGEVMLICSPDITPLGGSLTSWESLC